MVIDMGTTTAQDILAMQYSEQLFPEGCDIKKVYLDLVRQWHPDVNKNPDANAVMAKINQLLASASRFASGKLSFTEKHPLGIRIITPTTINHHLDAGKDKYANNAVKMTWFRFVDDKMMQVIGRYLPAIDYVNGVISTKKIADVYRLSSYLEYYDGAIPHRAVAWMISRLLNLACYFEFSGFAHNGIEVNSCFIDHEKHQVYLLDGWFYARPVGETLVGVPQAVYQVMPVLLKSGRKSGIETDMESIKALGRTLLGKEFSKAPDTIRTWLNTGASSSVFKEFQRWDEAIVSKNGYGERRFTPMDVNMSRLKQIEWRV